MPVNALHHITVLTEDTEKTADFFRTVLELTDGFAPELGVPVVWLYCGDQPVVHIVGRAAPGAAGCGRIDHIAFQCSDYPGFKARVDASGAKQMEQTLADVGVHQIFVESPEGVWVELVFPYEEYRQAKGVALENA